MGPSAAPGAHVKLDRIGIGEFEALSDQWDALVGDRGPFLTSAWLAAWWRAFAPDDGLAVVLMDGDRLLAGGCFRRPGDGPAIASATNDHSGDWDIVAADADAALRLWEELLAACGPRRLRLDAVPGERGWREAARGAMAAAGFGLVEEEQPASPWTELPGSLEELLAARSRNLRSQVGRRRRALEQEGELVFRTTAGGPGLERDLERFFEIEASGWKRESGTAIALDPALLSLYREFASAAAEAGWLRLYMLELDGRLVAADYGCACGGCGYLLKTAFDEDLGRFAPGLVLRAEVLAASIEEGLSRYDFLGGPDSYKLRWAKELRPRVTLRAFRGPASLPARFWWSAARPALKRAREALRERRAS